MIPLPSAPTIATIDENYNLIANWQPDFVTVLPSFYEGWTITLQNPPVGGTPVTTTVASPTLSFTQQLSAGDYSMTMTGLSSDVLTYTNSNPWLPTAHNFPLALLASDVSFDNTNLLRQQPFTITLDASYAGANSWQIIFPDGTSTGWLPLSTRSVAKSLNTIGAQNVIIQTQNDYGVDNPAVKLRRQLTQQIYVVDQQYNPTSSTQGNLTGTLGIGGNIGFEVTDASTNTTTPQPYEVVVRSIARDMVTNELKLMVATSRFSNASSLLSTMAIDVFPMAGRPHAKDLIEPPYTLEVTSTTSSIPVSITTTTLPTNVYVGKPMTEFPMAATGGTPSYSWFAEGLPTGLKMSTDGVISGTPTQLGTFTVVFAVMDSSNPAYIAETTLSFNIPTDLKINAVLPFPNAIVGTAYPGTTSQITNTGGLAPYTWAVVAGALPVGMTINPSTGVLQGVPCSYTSKFPNSDYTETYSFVVQVTDAINAKASQNFTINLAPAALTFGPVDQPVITASEQYKLAVPVYGGRFPYSLSAPTDTGVNLVNGQLEFIVSPTTLAVGTFDSFKATVIDSSTPPQVATGPSSGAIQYKVKTPVSSIYVSEAFFDRYWETGDTASVTHSILGNLAGFAIQSGTTTSSNGLTVTIDGSAKTVTVTGPPTAYLNSQTAIQIPLLQGSTQVATITREYTLLSHDAVTSGSPPTENIGDAQCFTRPYLVGEKVGLNPLKSWFNSPSLTPVAAGSPPVLTGLTARVQAGSSLPLGLSFDSNTMLIYGTLLGTFLSQSIIEYIDSNNVIQGTITIVWDTQINNGAFSLTDNIVDGQTGTPITSGASIISSSGITSASIYRGVLPLGLSLAVDSSGNFVSIVGTPTEAGYFDLWFRLTNSSGQVSFLYHRLFIDYIPPLVILSSLPPAVQGSSYSFQLQGFGGVPFSPPAAPYTWSMTGNPGWLSLSASGLLTATTVGTGPVSLNVTITDSRGVQTTSVLPLTVINAVTITTTVIPTVQVSVPYNFTVQAVGGVTPYTWSCPQLPLSGISLNASTGVLSGTTSVIINPTTIAVTVTDHVGGISSKNFQLQTGAQGGMSIDTSGVGAIDRGAPYQGTLRAIGSSPVPNLPVAWQVASDSPHPLPSGLILQANPSDQGTTAIISGSLTTVLSGYTVKVHATDAIGNPADATLSLSTTSSLAITTTSLPQGIINVAYSYQLAASGYNTPFTWSVVTSSPAWPYSLSSSGLITGSTGSAYAGNVTFRVTDSLSPADTATATLPLIVSASTLTITTASLPQGTAGNAYTAPLAATGGSSPYTWSISPFSANPLPSGLNISGSAITGTTTFVGTTSITVRVTDNIGAHYDKVFALTFISGLTLKTGVDYTDSVSTSYLGYISTGNTSSINPRTNSSFYVIATGVITTSPTTLASGITITNSGYTASVDSLVGGVARIRITGPFATGTVGANSFGISVTDSGVTATGAFKWKVYADGTLRAVATNAFPTQLVSG
jgi:hypothetical protein